MAIRPKVGGFPYLAETLRRAGVTRNTGSLPACQSIFLTNDGPVVMQGDPLVSGLSDIPAFDREGLIKALRTDQAGESTFPEFLAASWRAGVVRYDVDFAARTVAYSASVVRSLTDKCGGARYRGCCCKSMGAGISGCRMIVGTTCW
jgi:uncharacterized protein YbcV (DUF1398 family)